MRRTANSSRTCSQRLVRVVLGAFAVVLVGGPIQAACEVRSATEVRLHEFHARHLSLLEALAELGRETRVCLAVEGFDSEFAAARVDFDVYDVSAMDVVSRILATSPGAKAVQVASVVHIRQTLPQERKLLIDHVVADFRAGIGTTPTINNMLFMTLALSVDPSIPGFASSFSEPDLDERIGPFHATGKTLGALLDLVLTSGKGGVWVAFGPGLVSQDSPKAPCWTILSYAWPREQLFRTLGSLTPVPYN
jgi:hypothetical protein